VAAVHEDRRVQVARRRSELKGTGYEIFIGALSVLSIVNLVLAAVIPDESLTTVVLVMNALLSAVLFVDFCYRLATAPSRSDYFLREFGWADLLASLPFQQLKVLRLFRLLRVVRLLRELGPGTIVRSLVRDRAESALYTLLLVGLLMLQFGSLGMLRLEAGDPQANIDTASDALWYSLVTMSTVGYGDQFPVTNGGRLLGGLIIIVGVGIFGTLTGFLANAFVAPRRAAAPAEAAGDTAP
jgi:voltage-gated potassium channel